MPTYEAENERIQGGALQPLGQIRQSSQVEHLYQKRDRLNQQLANVNAAIEALEKHPDLKDLLHLISIAM